MRQFDRHRDALVDAEFYLHAFLEIDGLVADDVGRDLHLIVALAVHEVVAVAVLVEIAEFAVFDVGALDLFGGLVALLGLHAVADPAHIDLGGRGAFAGVEVLGVQHGIKPPLDFNDIAFAKRTGDDFHG